MSRKILDLFAGAGGFSLGAHLAGFRTVAAVEWDPDLSYSYELNFPRSVVIRADIRNLDPTTTLTAVALRRHDIAGIIGGPPCQGFSVIGKRDPNDSRNLLVVEYFRFVAAIRPRFFVMENVPGILLEGSRHLLDRALEQLGPGYRILGPLLVDAAEFGAPTRRRRALVIGYREEHVDPLSEADIVAARSRAITTREAISDLPSPTEAVPDRAGDYWISRYRRDEELSDYAKAARAEPPRGLACRTARKIFRAGRVSGFQPTAHTPAVVKRFEKLEPGARDAVSKAIRLRWDSPAPTIRAGTGKDRGSFQAVRPIHPEEHRAITVREAARLQGFPDWFRFHPTRWHSFRMIGNSVSPILAKAILQLIRSRISP